MQNLKIACKFFSVAQVNIIFTVKKSFGHVLGEMPGTSSTALMLPKRVIVKREKEKGPQMAISKMRTILHQGILFGRLSGTNGSRTSKN